MERIITFEEYQRELELNSIIRPDLVNVRSQCVKCGKIYITNLYSLYKRNKRNNALKNINVCSNCASGITSNIQKGIPLQLAIQGTKYNPVQYNDYINNLDILANTNKLILLQCKYCHSHALVKASKLSTRKYCTNEPICNKCISKATNNTNIYKAKMSLSIQNAVSHTKTKQILFNDLKENYQYYNSLSKKDKNNINVELICDRCKQKVYIALTSLLSYWPLLQLCGSCKSAISQKLQHIAHINIDEGLRHRLIMQQDISFDEYQIIKNYPEFQNFSNNVHICCDICKHNTTIKISQLFKHVYFKHQQICNNCILTVSNNNSHRLKKLSEAIRNRIYKKHKQNPNALFGNFKSLQGSLYGIRFDSSYELSYLIYCLHNNIVIERAEYCIPYYIDNTQRFYYPDFYLPNKQIVVEIKCTWYKPEATQAKQQYAIPFLAKEGKQYKLYSKQDLIDMGVQLISSKNMLNNIKQQYGDALILKYIPKTFC